MVFVCLSKRRNLSIKVVGGGGAREEDAGMNPSIKTLTLYKNRSVSVSEAPGYLYVKVPSETKISAVP